MSRKRMPSFGKSGMSRMRLRRSIMCLLYHIHVTARRPAGGQRRQVEERVPGDVVLADLEMEVRARCLPRAADDPDHVALADVFSGAPAVLAVVRVDGRVTLVVCDDDEVPIAPQPVAVEHASRARGADGRALRRADVDPVVVAV